MFIYNNLSLLNAISEAPVSAFPEKWMIENSAGIEKTYNI